MCYRCDICRAVVKAGQPRLFHTVLRDDNSIERELSVCTACQRDLQTESLADLLRQRRRGQKREEKVDAGKVPGIIPMARGLKTQRAF